MKEIFDLLLSWLKRIIEIGVLEFLLKVGWKVWVALLLALAVLIALVIVLVMVLLGVLL
jgi:hypothetical protein